MDNFRDGSTSSEAEEGATVWEIEDGDPDEPAVAETVAGGSLTAAVFGIIKGMVGPAILYLPHGFSLSGYLFAVPAMILSTIVYLYSANRLLESCREESRKNSEKRQEELRALTQEEEGKAHADAELTSEKLSYPELARSAFGDKGCTIINLGIAFMQFGVCLTYLIFVPQNLHESIKILFNVHIPMIYLLGFMVAVEIPLSWIKNIRKLMPTNILATLLILYGLVCCLGFALFDPSAKEDGSALIKDISHLRPFKDTWYLFIGTSVLLFEGSITLLVPLQEAVYKEKDREAFPRLYKKVIVGIICFYVFFGITCWASFGDSVHTVLTTSLPEGIFATSIQFAYSIAVILTFPLQNFPALEVVCQTIEQKSGATEGGGAAWRRNAIASVIVCLLAVVAILTIDNLGNVVSLLGSLLGVPIAFIVPPLIHNRLFRTAANSTKVMNNIVAGLGVVAMFVASLSTIVSWDKGVEKNRVLFWEAGTLGLL
mmetsp:Transcript_53355/g.79296  ORF Transcript_53355/g.79296 Transcript_53355/m.79296 type:complete len:486 (+) Transcript_53355:3-1460(+)